MFSRFAFVRANRERFAWIVRLFFAFAFARRAAAVMRSLFMSSSYATPTPLSRRMAKFFGKFFDAAGIGQVRNMAPTPDDTPKCPSRGAKGDSGSFLPTLVIEHLDQLDQESAIREREAICPDYLVCPEFGHNFELVDLRSEMRSLLRCAPADEESIGQGCGVIDHAPIMTPSRPLVKDFG